MGSGYEIARAVEFCVAHGHPLESVWRYTPRQLQGWIELIMRRRVGERVEAMTMFASASRAEPKELQKQIKALTQEAR
jgi:hypothetical protein